MFNSSSIVALAGNGSWLDAGGKNNPQTLNYKLIKPSTK